MGTNILNGTFVPGTDSISVHGTFDGWGAGMALVQRDSSTVYTNTVDNTHDANGGVMNFKFVNSNPSIGNGGYESLPTGQNRAVLLPATSGASLTLPTPFFGDSGAAVTNSVGFQVDVSQQIALGVFTPGTSYVEVRGLFNGWTGGAFTLTNNPNIFVTNQFGLVTSNVWVGSTDIVGSPAGVQAYKYVLQPGTTWDSPDAANSDSGNNRYFFNVAQTLPLVNFADAPFAPLSTNLFSVDMSAQVYYGNWDPSMPVELAGGFTSWATSPILMTNNPSAANTNIYYAEAVLGEGSTPQYKFIYQAAGGTVWENPNPPTLGGNRFFTVPTTTNYNVLPTVFFSDLSVNDVLATNVWVTFTVNMTNASQYPTGPAFDPNSDSVFVNSPNFNGSWFGWDPISLAGNVLTNNPVGSEVYQGTFMIPKGQPINITYKFGINGADNEAGSGNNHGRVVRTLAINPPSNPYNGPVYNLPMDTFGNQYNEPSFGQLAAAKARDGTVQVTWLGAPNVAIQASTRLPGNVDSWINHPETGGAVWSAGTNGPNGLVSVTNWPASGNELFFRLRQH
jgi:hypothetical protein